MQVGISGAAVGVLAGALVGVDTGSGVEAGAGVDVGEDAGVGVGSGASVGKDVAAGGDSWVGKGNCVAGALPVEQAAVSPMSNPTNG